MWFLYVVGVALIALGLMGFGGRGKLDLGDFGKFSGPAAIILGIAAIVLAAITGQAGL